MHWMIGFHTVLVLYQLLSISEACLLEQPITGCSNQPMILWAVVGP